MPGPIALDASSWLTAAPFSWTRLAMCPSTSKQNCCVRWNRAPSSGWGRRARGAWTCELFPPPILTCARLVLPAHFLFRYASRYRRTVQRFESSALQLLTQYSWPGNVRELEHTLERAVLMCRTDEIQPADLALNTQRAQTQGLEDLSLEAVEAMLVRKALQRYQGNVSQAAEALGLSRGALYRRMEKYGL